MSQKNNAIKKEQLEAYKSAVRFLGIREHNEHELREKLSKKNYDDIIIDDVIELLKQYDYLSEMRYAETFLRSRLKKGETPWLAAQKARQKGAEAVALKTALIDAEQGFDAWAACKEVLDKRDPTGLYKHDKRVWQRQMRYLQNKGYDIHTILQVMNNEDETT
ncbi:regulatory protein RecX [Ghiorsea bivora]|uniref:regulatory protein RecX n=1 Tax=Ghiorsea bivora TaxID=1485545 RepID=UPI001E2DB6EA|nr:regulatory protein RecX [Ghiorsea bivora]